MRRLPISSAGWGHPARGFAVATTYRVNRPKGFPLRGKLSPQVTDEGATSGHFPLIRRVPRHLPPRGEGFCVAAIPVMRTNGQTARTGQDRPLQTCRKRRTITGLRGNKNIPHRRGGALPRPRPNGNCDITGKSHGTHLCVPYKPDGNLHSTHICLPSGCL